MLFCVEELPSSEFQCPFYKQKTDACKIDGDICYLNSCTGCSHLKLVEKQEEKVKEVVEDPEEKHSAVTIVLDDTVSTVVESNDLANGLVNMAEKYKKCIEDVVRQAGLSDEVTSSMLMNMSFVSANYKNEVKSYLGRVIKEQNPEGEC